MLDDTDSTIKEGNVLDTPIPVAVDTPTAPDEMPMIQVAHATQIRNPWVCMDDKLGKGCGAIMGSVVHEKVRPGLGMSRLMVFRGAIKIDEDLPVNFIFSKMDAGEVVCSRCGKIRKWHPSPEVMHYLSEGNHHVKKVNRNV